MAALTLGLALGGAAVRGVSRFMEARAERQAREKFRREALAALMPAEIALRGAQFGGISQNQAFGAAAASRVRAGQFVGSGFGRSTLTGPAALEPIAQVMALRDQQIRDETFRLAAARQQILAASADVGSPTAAAFGGFLGDTGDILALQAGRRTQEGDMLELIRRLRQEEVS